MFWFGEVPCFVNIISLLGIRSQLDNYLGMLRSLGGSKFRIKFLGPSAIFSCS